MTTNGKQPNDDYQSSEKIGEFVSIRQRGRNWYANFQLEGQQHRQSLHTQSKKEARRRAVRLDADLQKGQRPTAGKSPSLESAIQKYLQYLENEGRARKTTDKYDGILQRLLKLADQQGTDKLTGITPALLDTYKQQRVADQVAKKTIHTEVVVIRQLVNFALSRKMITADPLQGIKFVKPKPRPQPCWSRQEVERILAAAAEPHRSVLRLLAETGLRIGELKHLTWDDIDFLRRVLLVREKDGWKPKTGDARAVPLTPTALELLQRLPRKSAWVFTAARSAKYPQGDHPISERRVLEYLKKVLKRLGLPGHLHTFRHAFISNALMQGIPEAIVRQWVGHVDPEILKFYTHILDESSQAAMQRLADRNKPTVPPASAGPAEEVETGSAQIQHNTEDRHHGHGAK